METLDYSKSLGLYGEFDVCVLGGGPAGVCAAIEAARNGAKVLLCEGTGMLGGMAASALVGPFMTCYDRDGNERVVGGIFMEIVERMKKEAGAVLPSETDSPSIYTSYIAKYHRHVTPFDSFALTLTLDRMVKEVGVHTLLYTRFADSVTENGKIKYVVLDAPQGLVAAKAKVYIDATGNADVAAASGVETWLGSEDGLPPQPATLFFEVDNAEDERFVSRPQNPVKCYRMPEKGRYKVNHHRVFGVDPSDADSMTAASMTGREQVLDAYRVLLETPGFEKSRITQVASVLGTRESRHIKGKYMLTTEDLTSGVVFPDAICRFGYGMDVHPRNDVPGQKNFRIEVAPVYTIPYRSLLPEGCDNLIVAGKTISAQSQAAGAIRVMPACMAMGQAAGCAAAIAVRDGVIPGQISTDELKATLVSHGAILPDT